MTPHRPVRDYLPPVFHLLFFCPPFRDKLKMSLRLDWHSRICRPSNDACRPLVHPTQRRSRTLSSLVLFRKVVSGHGGGRLIDRLQREGWHRLECERGRSMFPFREHFVLHRQVEHFRTSEPFYSCGMKKVNIGDGKEI
jgi:hypothetical protein